MTKAIVINQTPNQSTALSQTSATNDSMLINLFLSERQSVNTIDAYSRDIALFSSFGISIRQSTRETLNLFKSALTESEAANATVRRVLSTVKSLFSFAHDTGYITFNPSVAIKLPKATKDTLNERILTESEVKSIINNAESPRDRAMMLTLYVTGMRVSELCALEWSALNADMKTVIFFSEKSSKTIAQTIKSSAFWQAVTDIKSADSKSSDKVFSSRISESITRRQVDRIVKRCAENAGITKMVSPHWLRHAKASHSLANGASIALVSKDLGHSSVAITSRYLHTLPSESSADFLTI